MVSIYNKSHPQDWRIHNSTSNEGNHWNAPTEIPKEIRELVESGGSFQTTAEAEGGFDRFNRQSFEAAAGNHHAALSASGMAIQNEERNSKNLRNLTKMTVARGVIDTTLMSPHIDLTDINLWDEDHVNITDDGIMRVAGDDGEFRDATAAEKLELEENSSACTAAVTTEEMELNQFLRDLRDGVETEVPEFFVRDLEEGDVPPQSLEEYEAMIRDRLPPHMSERIIADEPLRSVLSPEFEFSLPALQADDPMSTPVPQANLTSRLEVSSPAPAPPAGM